MSTIEAPEFNLAPLSFIIGEQAGLIATKGDFIVRMTIGKPNVDSCDSKYVAIILYKDGILDICNGTINKFNTRDQILKELFRRHE